MPTYDYVCKNCGYEFDQFQSISAQVLEVCPNCNERHLKRLIGSGGAVIFRGNGFYCTDYKRKKPKMIHALKHIFLRIAHSFGYTIGLKVEEVPYHKWFIYVWTCKTCGEIVSTENE